MGNRLRCQSKSSLYFDGSEPRSQIPLSRKMGACNSERRERRKSDLKMSRKKIANQIWAQILPDYQVKKTGVYKVVDDHAMLGVEVETSDFYAEHFLHMVILDSALCSTQKCIL